MARKVTRVQEAGAKSWQADAWWLERNYPDMYGRTQRVEIESKSISVNVEAKLTEGQQQTLARLLAESQENLPLPLPKLPEHVPDSDS